MLLEVDLDLEVKLFYSSDRVYEPGSIYVEDKNCVIDLYGSSIEESK